MTQHNAALVEETNAAIEQTETQAAELDQVAATFRMTRTARPIEARQVRAPQPQPAGRPSSRRPSGRTLATSGNAALSPDWTDF
jgi:methyl-accepting chemotaxis protein